MPKGIAKTKLKNTINRKELLLSSTEHGSAQELTDDNEDLSDDNDDKIPVQHAVAVPVVEGIKIPRKLASIKPSNIYKNSPRRSKRRGILERLADARKQEAIIESKQKALRRTKRAYKREEDQGDREDNDSGSESDDSWGDTDGDSLTSDDDEVGKVVAASDTKDSDIKDSETRPASPSRGSASRKKGNKSKKKGKKGKKGNKGKKGGKKTRRKS